MCKDVLAQIKLGKDNLTRDSAFTISKWKILLHKVVLIIIIFNNGFCFDIMFKIYEKN